MTHTHGPWHMFSNSAGVGATAGHADVAHCHGFDTSRTRQEEEANARLIAAAPGLLEALEAIDGFWTAEFPDGPDGSPDVWGGFARLTDETLGVWRQIRAAIGRAKGGA